MAPDSTVSRLVASLLGDAAAGDLLTTLEIDPRLIRSDTTVSRSEFAMALGAVLFADLLERVPTGAAYVADVRKTGQKVCFDHGAVRTVQLPGPPTGAAHVGEQAIARILRPLGYAVAGVYPLAPLRMTGRAYMHRDLPATIPQFFVSELHVDRLPQAAQSAATRVFGAARDPLGDAALTALRSFSAESSCAFQLAAAALPEIAAAFGRWHDLPTLEDYRLLLSHSAEAAWIATEGQAFNHATDRVADVEITAETQRRLGRPIKDAVEVSRAGSVRQTAFRADPVERVLNSASGPVRLQAPGSFYEFISRDNVADGAGGMQLDLRFDSANAQGIFKMTQAA